LKIRAKKKAQQRGVPYKKAMTMAWRKIQSVWTGNAWVIIGATLWFNPSVKTWREYQGSNPPADAITREINGREKVFVETKVPVTTIPFIKTHEFNYSKLLPQSLRDYSWILYILIVIFIITAVSNGANITDGLDGLVTGTSALIGVCLGVFAYASGSFLFADYLNIMYIPEPRELSVFIGALIGAALDFCGIIRFRHRCSWAIRAASPWAALSRRWPLLCTKNC
jgi:phospho-N-acetylmuramoyl-pentapeptide-transferase